MTPVTRRRWLVALLLAMPFAAALTPGVIRFSGIQRSTWMRVVVDGGAAPPPLRVAYRENRTVPVIWEDAARSTVLGIRSTAPVRLLSIDSDRGALPPWLVQTWGMNWERLADPPALLIRQTGIVDLQGVFHRFTLTFAPAPASVDVAWLDQHQTLDLSTAKEARSVTLSIPAQHRGWVLLPPEPIDRIAIRSDGGPFVLNEILVRGIPPQNLRGVEAFRPINQVPLVLRLSIWLGLTAVTVLCLWSAAGAVEWFRRSVDRYEFVETPFGRWVRARTATWTLMQVAAVVLLITFGYHLSYAVSVPVHFNFDSLGYYSFGRNLLFTRSLDAIGTCRTPGYPLAIASSILLFGDNVRALVVGQHLALCVLGTVVVWFLYPRVGPLWAGIGGVLAGVSPIVSLTANMIWTESLFVVFSMSALLVFVRSNDARWALLAASGVLAGIATLIRPNGVVIVAMMAGWLFLRWWCDPRLRGGLSKLVRPAAIVVVTFAVVMSPWLLHFHRVTGHWGVSDANCAQEGQTHAASSGLAATNIFQLAGFVNLISQSDVGGLAITEPHKVFFDFFPARHRYYVERFLPWELTYDDRMPGELFREYVRVLSARYLRQFSDALVFNLTHHQSSSSSIFLYPDVEDLLTFQRTRPYPIRPVPDTRASAVRQQRVVSWADAGVLLTTMTSAPAPARSPVRSLHLRIAHAAMMFWGVTALLSGLGAVACLIVPGLRGGLVLAWHAAVLVLAPAVLAMGADRYAMVAEPALYVLAAILLSVAASRWPRRRERPAMREYHAVAES